MPSKNDLRLNVTFPDKEFRATLRRDAEKNRRSESSHIIWVLEKYVEEGKKAAEVFTPTQLRQEEQDDTPVYGTRRAHVVEAESKAPRPSDRQ